MNNNIYVSNKSKTTAGIFAILLGGLGLHHFYLDNIGLGIVYLLFCWTGIPSIIGLVEGIVYLTSSDQSFNRKYGKLKSF
ncbi:TM2 domain-containing protein [Paenibacillus sp. FSL H8-0034]|uniref:TM2 domain-containing protein n=1 Tax=Paenibacillus sp. FSL H8-0034 TaxID=2954671 RepID=UPI0030FC087E